MGWMPSLPFVKSSTVLIYLWWSCLQVGMALIWVYINRYYNLHITGITIHGCADCSNVICPSLKACICHRPHLGLKGGGELLESGNNNGRKKWSFTDVIFTLTHLCIVNSEIIFCIIKSVRKGQNAIDKQNICANIIALYTEGLFIVGHTNKHRQKNGMIY